MDIFILCYEDQYEGGSPHSAYWTLEAAQAKARKDFGTKGDWSSYEDRYWSVRISPEDFARIYKISVDSPYPVG